MCLWNPSFSIFINSGRPLNVFIRIREMIVNGPGPKQTPSICSCLLAMPSSTVVQQRKSVELVQGRVDLFSRSACEMRWALSFEVYIRLFTRYLLALDGRKSGFYHSNRLSFIELELTSRCWSIRSVRNCYLFVNKYIFRMYIRIWTIWRIRLYFKSKLIPGRYTKYDWPASKLMFVDVWGWGVFVGKRWSWCLGWGWGGTLCKWSGSSKLIDWVRQEMG